MNAYQRNLGFGLLVAAVLLSLAWLPGNVVAKKPPKPPPPERPVLYSEQVLLTPVPDAYSVALDVNDDGTIVGRYRPESLRAIVWHPDYQQGNPVYGIAEDLTDQLIAEGLLHEDEGITLFDARCINNDGLIIANAAEAATEHRGVFACNLQVSPPQLHRWMLPNDTTAASAYDISETGMVVGHYGDPVTDTTVFLWDPANDVRVIVDLRDENNNSLTPTGRYGINAAGTYVVGTVEGQRSTPIFGFAVPSFEDPGTYHVSIHAEILANDSDAWLGRIDVNDAGTVAGSIPSRGQRSPARQVAGGDWELLTNSRKQSGESSAINSLGDICGIEWESKQGFVFFDAADPSFWELDELLVESPQPAPWLREPFGMSNSAIANGFPIIVGDRWETADQGPQRAVVLVPE